MKQTIALLIPIFIIAGCSTATAPSPREEIINSPTIEEANDTD